MRSVRTAVALTSLVLAVGGVAAGCGGSDGDEAAPPPATETTPDDSGGGSVDGAAVYADAGCGGCHTLAAADSSGTVGPSLDGAGLDADTVAEQVRNGGGAMPGFSDSLSDEEIQAVAEFVATASS